MALTSVVIVGNRTNHHLFYDALIRFFSQNNYLISVITNTINYDLLKNNDYDQDVEFFIENSSYPVLLNKNLQIINQHSICIIDEYLDSFVRLGFVQIKCNYKIQAIHNANHWFFPKFRNLIRYFDKIFLKRFWFNQFDAFIVVSPNVKKYVENFIQEKPVFLFPFENLSYVPESKKKDDFSKIVLTIPGKVDSSRRDYWQILNTIEIFLRNKSKPKLYFYFLGVLDAEFEKEILEKIQKINSIQSVIFFSTSFISKSEFSLKMNETTIVLSNNYFISERKNSSELYGITKETGIIYAALKYQKPILMNSFTPSIPYFESNFHRYFDTEDLLDYFYKINDDVREIDVIYENIGHNSNKYIELFEKDKQRLYYFLEGNIIF